MSAIQAKARVQITVEIQTGQPWGEDCSIGQLYKQAGEDAVGILTRALKPGEHGRIVIVGVPKITGIITENL